MTLSEGISQAIEAHPLLCIRPMATDFGDLLLLLQSLSAAPRCLCEALAKEERVWVGFYSSVYLRFTSW